MIKGKAIIADGKGNFNLETISIHPPQGDEVLVKIKAAGVCHTDYDSYKQWDKPFILGHEGAGIVLAVGEKVQSVREGDHVILNWAIPCGKCFQCNRGNENICEEQSPVTGKGHINKGHVDLERTVFKGQGIERSFNLGTMSTHTVVKEAAIFKMNEKIPFDVASIIGCGVMTGFGSVMNTAKVEKGASVVVLGAGGVGLNVIQGARISKASKIIAIDINDSRLEMSKFYGATDVIKASNKDHGLILASEKVKELTDGRGADYAFECTGIPSLGAAPLAMVRNAGMAVQVSGIEEEITIDMNLFEWDKIYINPLYGKCRPQVDFPKIINHYKNGELLIDEMITRTYNISQVQNAFDDMLAGKNAKGVIVF